MLIMLLQGIPAAAQLPVHRHGPGVTFGIEWGSSFLIATRHNDNFICSEGYRIEQKPTEFPMHLNGDLLASVGMDIARKHNASFVGGYSGISDGRRMFPIMARYTFAANGNDNDGMLVFLTGGIGIPADDLYNKLCYTGSLGAGYRAVLNHSASLDIKCSLRNSFDHPGIIDPDTGKMVTGHNVRTNNAFHYALCITAAVNF